MKHFGRTDKIALITCLEKSNVSGAFLDILGICHAGGVP